MGLFSTIYKVEFKATVQFQDGKIDILPGKTLAEVGLFSSIDEIGPNVKKVLTNQYSPLNILVLEVVVTDLKKR